jgi:GntR family transcriptional regulator, vanillate catabolism transcriptional regulator
MDEQTLSSDPGASGVVATLRQRIVDGSLAPGLRLAEAAMAQALGVSRTPVRLAFKALEQEGLLHKQGKRGLVVREFSPADVQCAVEVRGVLEGLAARRLAQRGLPAGVLAALQDCVAQGQAVLAKGHLLSSDIARWSALNRRFHDAIVGGAGSTAIGDAIARNNHLPFASADSISIDPLALDREYQKLCIAQLHHELVLDALQEGESARVEMLMREHALIGLRYGPQLGRAGSAFTPVHAPTDP